MSADMLAAAPSGQDDHVIVDVDFGHLESMEADVYAVEGGMSEVEYDLSERLDTGYHENLDLDLEEEQQVDPADDIDHETALDANIRGSKPAFGGENSIADGDEDKLDESAEVMSSKFIFQHDPSEVAPVEDAQSMAAPASLAPGPHAHQEDAMSEIDYDRDEDGTGNTEIVPQLSGQNAAELQDESLAHAEDHEGHEDYEGARSFRDEENQAEPREGTDHENPDSSAEPHYDDDDDDVAQPDDDGHSPVEIANSVAADLEAGGQDAPVDDKSRQLDGEVLDNVESNSATSFAEEEPEADYEDDTDYMDINELDQSPDDFSNPPNVQIQYRGTNFALFQTSYEDSPDSFFFSDMEALDFPLSQFLASLRETVEDVADDDEMLIRVDGLGLEFAETMDKKFLDRTNFRQLVHLHDQLVRSDDPDSQDHVLNVFLTTRPNCLRRLDLLVLAASTGDGLETHRLSYPEYLTRDFPFRSKDAQESVSDHTDNVHDDENGDYKEIGDDQNYDVDASYHEDKLSAEYVGAMETYDDDLGVNSDNQAIDEDGPSGTIAASERNTSPMRHSDSAGDATNGTEEPLDPAGARDDDSAPEVTHDDGEQEVGDHTSAGFHDEESPYENDSATIPEVETKTVDTSVNELASFDQEQNNKIFSGAAQTFNETENGIESSLNGGIPGANEDFDTMNETDDLENPVQTQQAAYDDTEPDLMGTGQDEWQDAEQESGEQSGEVLKLAEVDEAYPEQQTGGLDAESSEQTSASGTVDGNEIDLTEAQDAAENLDHERSSSGGVDDTSQEQKDDIDEIDWQDNDEEALGVETHVSTPSSNYGKRGRAEDGDELINEHDVKRHRV